MSNKEIKKLAEKLIKASTIKDTELASESDYFNDEETVQTPIPVFNLFLSGEFDRGYGGFHYAITGASASLKSIIGLILMKSYLSKYDDAIAILYDSEKGISKDYLEAFKIPTDRLLIKRFQTLEILRNDLIAQLEAIDKGQHVFILIDSVSNSGSKKEMEDTLTDKTTQDLTRSRIIKSIFRLATGYITSKNIPLVSINHLYSTMDQYKPNEMSGGSGIKYTAQVTLEITKLSPAKGEEEDSKDYRITIRKSRFVQEGANFRLNIPKKGSIKKLSGLFELAEEHGYIVNSGAWFKVPCLADYEEKSVRRDDIKYNSEFWKKIFELTDFKEVVQNSIKISRDQSLLFDDINEESQELTNSTKTENNED